MDSNLYILEVLGGTILYLSARTEARDGWWWGTDNRFLGGPFESYEPAVEDARRHTDKPLNLIVWNADNFNDAGEPSPSGNLIVIDTGGSLWLTEREFAGDPPA
jgi:hypothetical protein